MSNTDRTDRRDGSPLVWILLASAIVAVMVLIFLARRVTTTAPAPALPPALKATGLQP